MSEDDPNAQTNVFLEHCESPIEERMGLALARFAWETGERAQRDEGLRPIGVYAMFASSMLSGETPDDVRDRLYHLRHNVGVEIVPQVKILRYRADFVVTFCGHRLVVECDGKEFHSTDDQLISDYLRTVEIEAAGYFVMRFKGRDIFRDPDACAHQCWVALDRRRHADRIAKTKQSMKAQVA